MPTRFVLLSVFTLIETICPKISANALPQNASSPLPVDVRRSKTSLLKLTRGCLLVTKQWR